MTAAAKIMVVDDEQRICENVEKILVKSNYEVVRAASADEAIEKMAVESFSLLISDIVMPGKNGLELLKLVKKEWPLTKAVMMTAYASTDTAVKAIRLGALDYIPKPFTPAELRSTVEKAMQGDLVEASTTEAQKEQIEVIDIDLPFDRDEVAEQTGDAYADMLGRSDMPVVEVKLPEPLENYCELGSMVCDIFKKLGATCKAGIKTAACPQKKAKKKKSAGKGQRFDAKALIGIDQPFNYEEVVSVTGPEYVDHLAGEGVSFVPYEELKKKMAQTTAGAADTIDVDIPFDHREVAEAVGEAYADSLTRSDLPLVEITEVEPLEHFCDVGDMVCDIFEKLGVTCKAGTKNGACPRKKAKKKAARAKGFDPQKHIGVELPFDYQEVAAAAGAEYVDHLHHDDVVMVPYAEVRQNVARMDAERFRREAAVIEFPAESIHKNILVIDDEVAVNNNIRKILKKQKYQVEQALSKDQALEKLGAAGYKLILLDLRMPGVKGLELLETIRSRQPQAQVIVITGYASIETAVEAARLGACDYLPKPFTPDEIRAAAANAIQIAA